MKKLLDTITKALGKKEKVIKEKKKAVLSEKDAATKEGKPWVKVINMEVDSNNPSDGYFELDWNDHFVTMLVNAGYNGKDADEIVDQWFNDLCNGIARQVIEEEKFVADAELLPKRPPARK